MLPSLLHIDPEKLRGKLIVLEGLDGMGKTELAKNLSNALIEYGVDVHTSRSPYGNHPNVEAFGQLTRFKEQSTLARWAVHLAAHAQSFQYEILPALAAGKTVVLDRWWWSAVAYNFYGDGLMWKFSEEVIFELEGHARQWRDADLIVMVVGESFRPEFTERKDFNARVENAYNGLFGNYHLPIGLISNYIVDNLEEADIQMLSPGNYAVSEEDMRHRSPSEMMMAALDLISSTFCPLPDSPKEGV